MKQPVQTAPPAGLAVPCTAAERLLHYNFNELSLHQHHDKDGHVYADQGIDGRAAITYLPDGEWWIDHVEQEVMRWKTPEELSAPEYDADGIFQRLVRKYAPVPGWMWEIAMLRLAQDREAAITGLVQAAIEADREGAAIDRAMHVREMQREAV